VQFLVLTKRRIDQFAAEAWTPELLESESQRVRELFAAGVVRSIWRRGDIPGAALMLETDSEEEARTAISSLPLAERGMLEVAALMKLEPYPGFGPR
jgi:muconolactone delta-isomerase